MVEVINSNDDLKIYENEKHFKVFAGPGAGKTHLIIENIKNIIQNSKKVDKDLHTCSLRGEYSAMSLLS